MGDCVSGGMTDDLLNFSWKGGIVCDEIYVGSQAVQCANCKAVDVIGFRD